MTTQRITDPSGKQTDHVIIEPALGRVIAKVHLQMEDRLYRKDEAGSIKDDTILVIPKAT